MENLTPNQRYNRMMRRRGERIATKETEYRCRQEISSLGDDLLEVDPPYHPAGPAKFLRGWKSRWYIVQLYEDQGVLRLTVQRSMACQFIRPKNRDRRPLTRRDLEAVKKACGYEAEPAIELYPPDEWICDVADMRHLWFPSWGTAPGLRTTAHPAFSLRRFPGRLLFSRGTAADAPTPAEAGWDTLMAWRRELGCEHLTFVTRFDRFSRRYRHIEVLYEVAPEDVPFMWRPPETDEGDEHDDTQD